MFQLFSVLCCSKQFHVVSYKSRCFVCFTHMLQVHVPNISCTLRRMLHSNVFMLQVFYIVRPEASGLGTRRAGGTADGGAAVGVRWERARPQLLIPAPECCCTGRERGVRVTSGGRDGAKCARGTGRGGQGRDEGGLRGRSDVCVRPNVRALATPYMKINLFVKRFIFMYRNLSNNSLLQSRAWY
jgi:hypothetical protein